LRTLRRGRSAGLFDLDYGRSETVSNSILWVIWPPLQGLMFAILMLRYLMSRSRRSYSLDAWHMIICLLVVAKLAPAIGPPYFTGLITIPPLFAHLIETLFLPLRTRWASPVRAADAPLELPRQVAAQ
jgi:hypothetical protein